jgi:LPXTG-site transpeptidase (sortase) family protein
MLEKTVDPDVGLPGSIVTFSLKVSLHPDANSDAFNVVLTDPLPRGLTYVAGSLRFISGVQPTSLDDSSAPLLRVGWEVYPMNGGETLISFQAELSNTSPGDEIENQAVLAWTSLPGNYLLPQSPYNPLSNERYYDPGSNVNTYGTSARARITIPALPATGFAPRQVTVLPQQSLESRYTQTNDLVLEIPALGVRIPIVGVPIRGGQWDLTWLSNQAGYLEGTAYPTLAGNTGLTAHVYDANGQPGPFVGLHTLKWGDEILIRAGGVTYYYQVRDVRRVMPNDLSPLKHEQRDWVTLITCQGFEEQRNAYRWRVAVRAVLMKVSP